MIKTSKENLLTNKVAITNTMRKKISDGIIKGDFRYAAEFSKNDKVFTILQFRNLLQKYDYMLNYDTFDSLVTMLDP